MSELLHVALMPVNLVFTVLLGLVLVYWVMVIVGALDFDFLNIDFDTDTDVDMDVDADMDVQGGGVLRSVLEFFYVGEIPVMVLVSVFALCIWMISVLGNYYLNPKGFLILSLPILAGNLVVSCMLVKIMAIPLRKLFKSLDADPNAARDVMGRICRIVTTEVTRTRIGQGEVTGKGAPVLLNVTAEGDHVFQKDDEAVIVGHNKETGVYLIAPVDLT
jgi:hypothetical protein